MWLVLLLLAVSFVSMLAGVALVLLWAVPKLENKFLFRPMREIFKTPADFGIPFEQHTVETPDGCRLSAWHICPHRPRASILYFHGNTGNLGLFNEVFQLLYQHQLQIFAIDYRGYGSSTGTPYEKGLYRDALAAVDYFGKNLKKGNLPILYWGRSLGCAVASYAASHQPPDGLVLETAFASKRALMSSYRQFRWFYPFSRCRLNTAKHLKGHRFPILLLHGDQDKTVPLEQGKKLFEMLTGPKDFFHVNGADHVNIHRLESQKYMERVLRFADEVRPVTVH